MARVGEEMLNPVTKERFVWRATAASTHGEYAEWDLHLGAGATVAAPHIHPRQRESFRVESGSIRIRHRGVETTLGPGKTHTVDPGEPHAWWNDGPGEAHVVITLTPALRSEEWFETFCGLAREGKVTAKGMPKGLQLAVMAHEFREEFGLPSAPARTVARPLVAMLAALGTRRGLRPRYEQYASS